MLTPLLLKQHVKSHINYLFALYNHWWRFDNIEMVLVKIQYSISIWILLCLHCLFNGNGLDSSKHSQSCIILIRQLQYLQLTFFFLRANQYSNGSGLWLSEVHVLLSEHTKIEVGMNKGISIAKKLYCYSSNCVLRLPVSLDARLTP